MVYSTTIPSSPSAVTRTYTGPCAINSPVAVCEFEVPSEDIPSGPPGSSGTSGTGDDHDRNMVQAAGPSRTGSGGVPLATGNGAMSARSRSRGSMSVAVGIAAGCGLVYGVRIA